jgi:hypothetical protein
MANADAAAPPGSANTYPVTATTVTVPLLVVMKTHATGAKRLALPPPVHTWDGATWGQPPTTLFRKLVIPTPIRRWDGSQWQLLYRPRA